MSPTRSPAMRRYLLRMALLMAAYIALLVGAKLLFRHFHLTGLAAYALALAPALPIIGVFWAVMRLLVEETDEYLRLLMVKQCMIATGFCLCVMTAWEFMQNFDLVQPGNGGFGAAFFWFIGLGLGGIYTRFRDGAGGPCQ